MQKRKRSKFWDKARQVADSIRARFTPLDKVTYTLDVFYEHGVYGRISLEKLNVAIYKAIMMMAEVGSEDRIDTQLRDHRTECFSGRASFDE